MTLLAAFILTLLSLPLVVNIFFLSRVRSTPLSHAGPLVSVLIPARNEEERIAACLEAFSQQRYRDFEILVLDDNSSDNTRGVVESFAQKNPRIRLLTGGELPEGWLGKPYACFQLAKEARGEILLFADADVIPSPDAISFSLSRMNRLNLDFLTLFPQQRCITWCEKVVVPLVESLVYSTLLLPLVRLFRSQHLSAANGQWMVFRRRMYEHLRGHEAVRGEIVEDIVFAKRVKQHSGVMEVLPGRGTVSCRMYRSAGEVFAGLRKNILLLGGGNQSFSLLLLALCGFGALLPLLAFYSPWALTVFLWLLIHRALTAFFFAQPRLSVFLFPVGFFILLLIGITAMVTKSAQWKGREILLAERSELERTIER